jgi:hypothetical protein
VSALEDEKVCGGGGDDWPCFVSEFKVNRLGGRVYMHTSIQ